MNGIGELKAIVFEVPSSRVLIEGVEMVTNRFIADAIVDNTIR